MDQPLHRSVQIRSLEVLIPVLYLKGISTGDFEEALIALLGKDADGLSASTISRLKEAWAEEHAHWTKHTRIFGRCPAESSMILT
jgi:hypothetical protein